MKKRLLLIFVVGISFSPSVFALGSDGVGPFNKANNGQEIYCATLHQWVKASDSPGSNQNTQEAGAVKAGSMTFQNNSSQGNNS